MNSLDRAILKMVDFIESTDEEVEVFPADDVQRMLVGFAAYYVKDGKEYSVVVSARVFEVKESMFFDFVASAAKRVELCKMLTSGSKLDDLKLMIKMHDALS